MVPFCGPSYNLTATKADMQRSVNLYLFGLETPGKAPFILDSIPGLSLFATLAAGEIRGSINVNGRCFVVAGNGLVEMYLDGTSASRGTLSSFTGAVSMDWGVTQLVIVDGPFGYVLNLMTNVFTQITSTAFYGSTRVRYLNARFLFIRPDTQQFYISAIDDALTFDALDFASAESSPDFLVSLEVDHGEAWLFGVNTTEVWTENPSTDVDAFAFTRNTGATIQVGTIAPQSVIRADNTVYWIGRDSQGTGIVYRAAGYTPQRISTHAIEEALRLGDLTQAVAYSYQEEGLTFIAWNAPGLTSTWVYEVSAGAWHERCDLDSVGQFTAHRARNHVFVFNSHLVGDTTGKLYTQAKSIYVNYLDPLVRERVSPHSILPFRLRQFFSSFWMDCTTGEAGSGVSTSVELSYFDWKAGGGWSTPILKSAGLIGERFARLLWTRLGSARDRVWKARFVGNAPFAIFDAGAQVTPGRN